MNKVISVRNSSVENLEKVLDTLKSRMRTSVSMCDLEVNDVVVIDDKSWIITEQRNSQIHLVSYPQTQENNNFKVLNSTKGITRDITTVSDMVERHLRGFYDHTVCSIGQGGDFSTLCSNLFTCDALAKVILTDMYAVWLAKEQPTEFKIYELGAGTGELMQAIIKNLIHLNSSKLGIFAKFFKSLKFTILDFKTMFPLQQKTLEPYQEQFSIDFCDFNLSRSKLPKDGDFFYGNEILDTQLPDYLKITRKGFELLCFKPVYCVQKQETISKVHYVELSPDLNKII